MTSTLASEAVRAVLDRLHRQADTEDAEAKQRVQAREAELGVRLPPPTRYELYGNAPLAIARDVGQLYYLLATSHRAETIVEFGASHGISTIYLAAALRDRGRGSLITTELLPGKAETARRNLTDAGLEDIVEIRVGDALQTLTDLTEPVDVLVLDGRNDQYLAVLGLVEPLLATNALVLADLGKNDPDLLAYQHHVRQPHNGYVSMELPLDAGIELSVRTSHNGAAP
jgi:predicted O-methyltransferase YrrM